jgi:hypothetical protein
MGSMYPRLYQTYKTEKKCPWRRKMTEDGQFAKVILTSKGYVLQHGIVKEAVVDDDGVDGDDDDDDKKDKNKEVGAEGDTSTARDKPAVEPPLRAAKSSKRQAKAAPEPALGSPSKRPKRARGKA